MEISCYSLQRDMPSLLEPAYNTTRGCIKETFRRTTNHVTRDCERDFRSALSEVSLQVAKNTARKHAQSYMRAYTSDARDSHLLIEKYVKICKCHREVLNQETTYLEKMFRTIQEHLTEVEEEIPSPFLYDGEGAWPRCVAVAEKGKEAGGGKQVT